MDFPNTNKIRKQSKPITGQMGDNIAILEDGEKEENFRKNIVLLCIAWGAILIMVASMILTVSIASTLGTLIHNAIL